MGLYYTMNGSLLASLGHHGGPGRTGRGDVSPRPPPAARLLDVPVNVLVQLARGGQKQPQKEGGRLPRPRLELGVELAADEEGVAL